MAKSILSLRGTVLDKFWQSLEGQNCLMWPRKIMLIDIKQVCHGITLEQEVRGVNLFIYCQNEDKYVTKNLSCRQTRDEDQDTLWEVRNPD